MPAGRSTMRFILDVDSPNAKTTFEKVSARLTELDRRLKRTRELDIGGAQAAATIAKVGLDAGKLASKLDNMPLTIRGAKEAEAKLLALEASADRLNDKLSDARIGGAFSKLAGAGFLQPSALGAAAALLPSLIPMAAGVAAGVAAVGVSFGAAAVGAAGFGATASKVLSSAEEDMKALQALNLKLNTATTASAKQAVRQQIAALKQGWTPAYRRVMADLDTLDTRWKAISIDIAAPTVATFLDVLKHALPDVKTALVPVAAVFDGWGKSLDRYFTNPVTAESIRRVAAGFGQFSASQLHDIGVFIAGIGKGVFHLGQDIGRSGVNFHAFGDDLARWGNGFNRWSQSKAARDDVRGLLSYLRTSGGIIKNVAGDLAKDIPGIFAGASAIGQLELRALDLFLRLLGRLPPGVAKPLTEAAGAMLLLSKTGVLKVGVKVVGSAANLLSGGTLSLGGSGAAAKIEAAFSSGGTLAAEKIRAALAGGGAGVGGEAAAGGAAAGAGSRLGRIFGKAFTLASGAALEVGIPLELAGLITGKGGIGGELKFLGGQAKTLFANPVISGFHEVTGAIKYDVPIWVRTLTFGLGAPFHKAEPQVKSGLGAMIGDVAGAKTHIAANWSLLHGLLHDPFATARNQNKVSLHTMENDVYRAKGDMGQSWKRLYGDFISPFDSAKRQNRASLGVMERDVAGAKNRINRDWQDLHGKRVALTFGLNLPAGVSYPSRPVKGHGGAAGWLVPGHGSGDTVPAMLTPGEAVVPKRLVPAVAPFLAANKVPGFASGGPVVSGAFDPSVGAFLHHLNTNFSAAMRAIIASVRRSAQMTAAAFGSFGGGGGGGPVAAVARRMFPWPASMWPAFNYVEMREAGYRLTARNPSSGAYGVAQFINGPSEYFQWGGNPYTAPGQFAAMYNYIRSRYGNPVAAAAHERTFNWYAGGTRAARRGLAWVGEHGRELIGLRGGETIFPHGVSEMLAHLAGYAKGTLSAEQRQGLSIADRFLFGNLSTAASIRHAIQQAVKAVREFYKGSQRRWRIADLRRVADRLEAKARRLAEVKSQIAAAKAYAKTVQGNLRSYAALSNVPLPARSQTAVNGVITTTTSGTNVAAGLRGRLAKLRRFGAMISRLARRGLSRVLLRQIIDMGPDDGLAYGRAILAGHYIREVNRTERAIQQATHRISRHAADEVYDRGRRAGRGFLTGLKYERRLLDREMERLGAVLGRAVARWFGVPRSAIHHRTHHRAYGGWITEPVIGYGQWSGDEWRFGERGTERVTPASGGGMGGHFTGELYLDSGQFLGMVKGIIREHDRGVIRKARAGAGQAP